MIIDLHIHSTASDGTLTPSEILVKAADLGLGAVSITDHDTLDGVRDVLNADVPSCLKFLPGIELSSYPPAPFSSNDAFHILGYGVDPLNPELNALLETLQQARARRNPEIIRRLQELGCDITLAEVEAEAGGGLVGRPHVARMMVRKGFALSIKEAFDLYLASGRAAHVEKFRIDAETAIGAIRQAGGIPVLAHPFTVGIEDPRQFRSLIRCLKELGLRGIEAFYSKHSAGQTAFYREVAEDLDLLVTGGSDFHGSLKGGIEMGSGRGDLCVPYTLYEKLVLELNDKS